MIISDSDHIAILCLIGRLTHVNVDAVGHRPVDGAREIKVNTIDCYGEHGGDGVHPRHGG